MTEIGFTLASEDWSPRELVQLAHRAEKVGFEYALISDHIHPWNDSQGSSPFVWSVIGGVSEATERLRVGTGVGCPLIRIHPAIVAHAAARGDRGHAPPLARRRANPPWQALHGRPLPDR